MTDRPRVVVLTTTLPAEKGDGTPAFVLDLATALSDKFDITIVAPRVRRAQGRSTIDGVDVVRFPYFLRRWEGLADGAILSNLRAQRWRVVEVAPLMVAYTWTAWKECRRRGARLIHAHWILPAGLAALILRKAISIPYVVTAHGADGFALQSPFFRLLKNRILGCSSVVASTSLEMAKKLGTSEGHVVPMGVDVAYIGATVGERAPERGRFLFVGRLEDKKGVDVLLRAVSLVRDATLVIVGEGRERPRLEALAAELGLQDRVLFLGRRSHGEVLQELRRAWALVIPSRVGRGGDSDTTPVVMSEAMAAGVPVLASELGGLSERITSGQDGLLFEPNSVPALASALVSALTNETRLEGWARAARDLVHSQLSLGVTADRYAAFYGSALGPSASKGTRSV